MTVVAYLEAAFPYHLIRKDCESPLNWAIKITGCPSSNF